MTLGNVVAIAQSNLKRMLAYSSIAHVGYMMVGLVAGGALGRGRRALSTCSPTRSRPRARSACCLLLERAGEEAVEVEDYAGLGRAAPAARAAR